jgi:transketolase
MTDKITDRNLANCLRFLTIDAIEKANSGHPGMPMGMADVATILFREFLKFNPKDPKWMNRDRFILSAGHGSMLLYSLLYLTGYQDISLDDIKNFRQLHSKCAGHPEFGELAGIETTTGPLGQGLGNAVGMAISQKILENKFSKEIFNHKIYALVGDGCLMEGIAQEALSIAGHLQLNNLIILWDNNSISIDGDTSITTSEDMKMRFIALGFEVINIDGHDHQQIRNALNQAQNSLKPILIDCKTKIGFGSPNKQGSEKCHGSALGKDEVAKTRLNLNWNYGEFEIPQNFLNEFRKSSDRCLNNYQAFNNNISKLSTEDKIDYNAIISKKLPSDFSTKLAKFYQEIITKKSNQATRKSSQEVLEFLTGELVSIIAGSADLTESVLTKTKHTKAISKNDFSGRYLHYGVREHAMSAIMNGISLHGNFIPYGGTFLVFSDYLKPAIRLSALMKRQVLYVFTHDSIGLGEDGPTHQPIEHLAMLRAIPNLQVFRPCDSEETLASYELAIMNVDSPSALVFSRQVLNFVEKDHQKYRQGGYIIKQENLNAKLDAVIIATGSEVQIAINAQQKLSLKNINVRVVSMLCTSIFLQQDLSYQEQVLGDKNILRIGVEAGIRQGLEQFILGGIFIGMNSFGASANALDLYKYFKITDDEIVNQITQNLKK